MELASCISEMARYAPIQTTSFIEEALHKTTHKISPRIVQQLESYITQQWDNIRGGVAIGTGEFPGQLASWPANELKRNSLQPCEVHERPIDLRLLSNKHVPVKISRISNSYVRK